MRRLLSLVMAKHIGQTITLELATAMAKELLGVVENPIDVEQFTPQDYKGYVLACERLEDIQAEIHPLHVRHYLETKAPVSAEPFNANYDKLIDMERAGQLMQFTARVKESSELVGSMLIYILTSINNQTLFSQEAEFYLVPEHRGGFLMVRLWQFAERAVQALGVKEATCDSKLANGADKMARYMNYTPVSTKFTKVFAQPATRTPS